MNPVHYQLEPDEQHPESGWYFWIETWADAYGPFMTREIAEEHLLLYYETL